MSRQGRQARLGGVLAATMLVAAIGSRPALADDAADGARREAHWIALGLLGGSTRFDDHLADYRWQVSPRAAYGAQALAGAGRFAAGFRVWRTTTVQGVGVAGVPDPAVHATTFELVGQGRLARLAGAELLAIGSVGRLHLGYQPDQLTIPDAGGGPPVVVGFQPVNEWTGGAGLAVRRGLAGPYRAGLEVERLAFGLETAHRNGNVIEVGRESFGEWSVRLELARVLGRW